MLDIELGVFLQIMGSMEVAGSLTPIDGNLWIFGPVNNPHGIPIGLCIVCHEAFEMRLGDSMAKHDVVEVMLEKNLSILVLGLEVAASDNHDALVGSVVYVAGHGGPLVDASWSTCSRSPPGCMCLIKSNPLPGPTSDIFKMKTLSVSSPWPGN
jgi:hypothetical protein